MSSSTQLNSETSGSKISSLSSTNNPKVSQLNEQIQLAKDESPSDSSTNVSSSIHISDCQNEEASSTSSISPKNQQSEPSLIITEQQSLNLANSNLSTDDDNAPNTVPKSSSPNKQLVELHHQRQDDDSIITIDKEIVKSQQPKDNLSSNSKALNKIFLNPFTRTIQEYSTQIASILLEEHDVSVQEQQKLFSLRRKELIFVASLARDFRLRQIELEYEKEKRIAHQDHAIERDSLKERMINELQERRKRASEDSDYYESLECKSFSPESLAQGSQLLLDSTNSFSTSTFGGNAFNSSTSSSSSGRKSTKRRTEMEVSKMKRRNIADVIGGNAGQLGEAEILEDLFLIFGDNYGSGNGGNSLGFHHSGGGAGATGTSSGGNHHHSSGKRKPKSLFTETAYNYIVYIKEQDGSFSYDGITYRKGDDVILEKDDQDDILGEIISISNNEIWIKDAEGLRVKVSISQLRLGKAFVSHVGTR